jgi:hypothetical protein
MQAPNTEASLNEGWLSARQATPKPMHKVSASATQLIASMIWKQRNACVFDGKQPSIHWFLQKIRAEAMLWLE